MESLAGIMKTEPGTYILILRSELNASVEIGAWGQLAIVSGYYAYVGSALGPGGLLARLSRHCRPDNDFGVCENHADSRIRLQRLCLPVTSFLFSRNAGRKGICG
jgi:hypothetical protein